MSRAATRAIAALVAAQVPHEVLRYHHDPDQRSFGAEAVEHLATAGASGLRPEQILKTLIVELAGAPPPALAVAVLPVPATLSLKAVAAAFGASRAGMADPAVAQRVTGYVLGGISPFGQRRTLPTVVDASASGFEKVLCSAGQRGWDVAVAPADLIRLTAALVADIRTR
ncbi:aminoacyl-tRNA deacylase [Mycolicibacter senuensis]|uniref:Cys-tRNA(Pro)/Cys-tRNA(Cys) deacylase n=1 Tax=Mycolicibacter senuensis TaxID=386913 RepID=A0A7I9XFC1_9MYCO|nr:aminoacyl-tRNA deacylase [Mycolicibacter senuensis]ORW70617.1 aminoacyl-tRNA deacylase [Mycolicibacter senuensis]GFG68661.1 Cys-tRNA(Pro)/Cys-tRNA(Cys) deacylase [Mycolicibacter senuensis]